MFLYIPVWIDLKVLFFVEADNLSTLYIPVWIDLKP